MNHNLTPNTTPAIGELGGDCDCGRGQTIGTCHFTSSRMFFRVFHDGTTTFHLENAADWVCVDCIADIAIAVATGEVRATLRRIAAERRNIPA
ncbi:hypothetical protein ACWD25_52755 [Streptomyces sp. NPDC002920]